MPRRRERRSLAARKVGHPAAFLLAELVLGRLLLVRNPRRVEDWRAARVLCCRWLGSRQRAGFAGESTTVPVCHLRTFPPTRPRAGRRTRLEAQASASKAMGRTSVSTSTTELAPRTRGQRAACRLGSCRRRRPPGARSFEGHTSPHSAVAVEACDEAFRILRRRVAPLKRALSKFNPARSC